MRRKHTTPIMTKLSLLSLLLLSPNTSFSYQDDIRRISLVNGFTPSSLITTQTKQKCHRSSSSSSLSFLSKKQHVQSNHATFLLPRGGGDTSSTTSSLSSSTATEVDIGPSLDVISQSNWDLLSDRGRAALSKLILYDMSSGHDGQQHVYANWPEVGVDDDEKRMLAEQVRYVCLVSELLYLLRISYKLSFILL